MEFCDRSNATVESRFYRDDLLDKSLPQHMNEQIFLKVVSLPETKTSGYQFRHYEMVYYPDNISWGEGGGREINFCRV